jgi:hypothetical protein
MPESDVACPLENRRQLEALEYLKHCLLLLEALEYTDGLAFTRSADALGGIPARAASGFPHREPGRRV